MQRKQNKHVMITISITGAQPALDKLDSVVILCKTLTRSSKSVYLISLKGKSQLKPQIFFLCGIKN